MRRVIQLSTGFMQQVPHSKMLFLAWTAILVVSTIAAVGTHQFFLLLLAPVLLGLYLTVMNFSAVYLLMWACIPLSTELEFTGGLATDFPAEGFMVLLTGVTIFWCAGRLRTSSLALLIHPITLVVLLHVAWIALTAIQSSDQILSVKFLLAKIWYIIPFYVLSYLLLRKEHDIRKWFIWVLVPLMGTIAVIVVRHAMEGFSFESVNEILKPFYRNHVDYALILGVFFPFIFVLRDHWLSKRMGWVLTLVFLLAIYLTYTRAAYLGLIVALAGYFLIRWKRVRHTILAALVIVVVFLVSLAKDNRYIDYAPDYYKTITHYKFDRLLEATYRFEDVSTMERFYRWIAAFYMVQEKPIFGFGPNNFVSFYRPYTDQHFVTYVSDNPEQSGVHNYFLMTSVEQGLPGLIIFLALLCIALLRAEWLYHRLKPGFYRKLLVGVIGSLFFILFALLLNDMIETDKVGSFFFLDLALIVIIERNARRENEFIHVTKPNLS